MSARLLTGNAPVTPLRFERVSAWLVACEAALTARGTRGALAHLAALLKVSEGHMRNLLSGARSLSASGTDRLGAAWSLSQAEVDHLRRIRLLRDEEPTIRPKYRVNAAKLLPPPPVPGALRAVELILACHPARLRASALCGLLLPPVNARTASALRRLACRSPTALSHERSFGARDPADGAWLELALSGASLSLGVPGAGARRVRTMIFTLADHEREELFGLAEQAITALRALSSRPGRGPRRLMQLLISLTPLSAPWEGAPEGAEPPLFDVRTMQAALDPPSPALLSPVEDPPLGRFDHPVDWLRAHLEWRGRSRRAGFWSQSAVAVRAGVSPSHVNNILEGARAVTEEVGEGLARGLRLERADHHTWTLMVRRSRSDSVMERAAITQELARTEQFRQARSAGEVAGVALSHLPCMAIDALVSAPGVPRAPEDLIALLAPSLSRERSSDALDWLVEVGLQALDAEGRLTPQPLPYLWLGGDLGRDLRVALHREALAWARIHQEAPLAAWGLGLAVLPEEALEEAMEVVSAWQAALRALAASSEQRAAAGPRRLYLSSTALYPGSERMSPPG